MYVVELQATNVLRKPFVILEQQYILLFSALLFVVTELHIAINQKP